MTTTPTGAPESAPAGGPAPTGNAATVAEIYAAFGRGDVGAILERLATTSTGEPWQDSFAQRAGVPWLAARRGRQAAAGFFEIVGGWTVLEFSVLDIIGTGRQVVAELQVAFELPDGGRFADEEVHLFTFDDDGRVARFRHYLDTAKHIAAARGEDTTVH